ncbi:transporter substrate-binding domain-containing protein [Tabrizicola sp.]|uniref:transporter substrate-binding domain-containing protein n=1 Tax=Tabrizicola sp. TaxID=2005166 RepID=UPI00260084DF|nr:transporter substrate-binding domain-containing protein [Tabrizicola sp.]
MGFYVLEARLERTSIPLGLLFSRQGSYGEVGTAMFRGAMLAVSEIAGDRAFDFDFAVRGFEPKGVNESYMAGARELLMREGLSHVVGCYTSSSRKEVLPVFEKHDALLWYPSHYEGFETSENIVYTGAAPNQHVVPLTRYLLAQGGRNAFMVGSNYIWAWENNRIMRDILGRNGGLVLGERYVPLGDTDLDEIIDLILRCRPDFIFNTLIGESAYSFFRRFRDRCARAGLNQPTDLPIVSCSLAEPELALIGPACDGHLSSSVYFSSIRTAANARFLAAWKAMYPAAGEPSADAEASYIAVHVLARAIRIAQSTEVPAVLAALKDVRFQAPQGPVSISAENRHSFLWPRIGRSRSDGTFDIIHESSNVVEPDPYLVWEPLTFAPPARDGLKVVS